MPDREINPIIRRTFMRINLDYFTWSIDAQERLIRSVVPDHAGEPGAVSGRQRLQGRNPLASAAAAVE